jgi:hypothetical protein
MARRCGPRRIDGPILVAVGILWSLVRWIFCDHFHQFDANSRSS